MATIMNSMDKNGFICGMIAEYFGSNEPYFTPWYREVTKRRVSYSSLGTEIIAAANADDRG